MAFRFPTGNVELGRLVDSGARWLAQEARPHGLPQAHAQFHPTQKPLAVPPKSRRVPCLLGSDQGWSLNRGSLFQGCSLHNRIRPVGWSCPAPALGTAQHPSASGTSLQILPATTSAAVLGLGTLSRAPTVSCNRALLAGILLHSAVGSRLLLQFGLPQVRRGGDGRFR